MGSPDISFVIPTYQRPELLVRCLLALEEQTFPKASFEVIVVTDGPDKFTRLTVNHYRETMGLQMFCWSLPHKRGPAAARNYGWRNARGKLIIFVDDDCLPAKELAAMYWKAFTAEQEICPAFTGKVTVPLSDDPTDYEKNVSLLESCEFVTANCACAKKCLEKVGGFDEAFEAAWREDSDLHFRFLDADIPIRHVPEAHVVHPVREAPWGVSLKEQRKSMYEALLYKKHPKKYRTRIARYPPWNYYGIIFSFLATLLLILFNSRYAWISGLVWVVLVALFMSKRLRNTSKSTRHVSEMMVTSILIPFLSVYWTIYGSIRYRTWFL